MQGGSRPSQLFDLRILPSTVLHLESLIILVQEAQPGPLVYLPII